MTEPLTAEQVQRIAGALQPGERLLWSGRADARAELRTVNWPTTLAIALFCIGTSVLTVRQYWIGAVTEVSPVLITLVFGVVGVAIVVRPFLRRVRAAAAVIALTDRRLLRLDAGDSVPDAEFPLAGLGPLTVTERADGSGDLKAATYISRSSRSSTLQYFTLVGVPEVARVTQLIVAQLPVPGDAAAPTAIDPARLTALDTEPAAAALLPANRAALAAELGPMERLRWAAEPGAAVRMLRYAPLLTAIPTLAFGIVWTLFSLFAWLASGFSWFPLIFVAVGVALLGIAVTTMLAPLKLGRGIAGTVYALTDQRLLRLEAGGAGRATAATIPISTITSVERVAWAGDAGTLTVRTSGVADAQGRAMPVDYQLPDVRDVETVYRLLTGSLAMMNPERSTAA